MSSDPLRSTLDHLALDPDAGVDRRYLVTVLRRLGYSDAQIREMVGAPGDDGRIIEVEYTGDGKSRFRFAQAGAPGSPGAMQFSIADDGKPLTFKLAGDPSAGVEELEGVEAGDADISGDWSDDWAQEESQFAVGDDWDDGGATEGFSLEGEEVVFKERGDEVVFKERQMDLVPFTAEGDDDPATAAGWIPVEGDAGWIEVDDDAWGPIDEAPGGAWPAEEDEELWEPVAEETEDDVFRYGDYTLYRRPVELKTGKTQDIYFFSKDEPSSGEPSPLPEGYEVAVSERTGLPFLRKAGPAQCAALTHDGKQCRLTAQDGSHYCHLHQDYDPPTEEDVRFMQDTEPAWDAEDTLPGEGGAGPHQCAAITAAGAQCRNTARSGSKYCASHKGYRPHSVQDDLDTLPVGKNVRDTQPAIAGRRDGQAGTRIRTQVVQARSRAEAERMVARQGGRVRGVVPVRIEESEVED